MNKQQELLQRSNSLYDYITEPTTKPNNGYLFHINYDDGSFYESVQNYNSLVANNSRGLNRDAVSELPTFSRRNMPNVTNVEFQVRGTKSSNNYYDKTFAKQDIYDNRFYPEILQDPTRNFTNTRI